ncbi:MAG: ATP-binding protein [Haliea sp.]|uniref:ATP-binding protein n=1 Tax=Haliea sp. TaxID=1932666 RepID=UPI0032EE5758
MKLSIQSRYIIAFMGLTLVVLIASLSVSRWTFERGFLGYVNDIEELRLQRAQAAVASEYRRAGGNWDGLTPRRLTQLLLDSAPAEPGLAPDRSGRPPPPPGAAFDPPPRGRQLPYPPTAVYDTAGMLVAGPSLEESSGELNRAAIVVDGVAIGELRSALRHQLTSPEEEAFLQQQIRATWMIGLSAMVLALVISIILARGMLSPIRRMHENVSELSSGDYSIRLGSHRLDELGDLMRNLDRLAVTLQESRESRQRWFANVSHELRTPVAVLAGELEAMQDGVRPVDAEQLESLMQEVQRLRFLIDDLYELSVSDIGGLRYEFSPIALDQSLASVVAGFEARAEEQGIAICCFLSGEPLGVNADQRRLDQLWHNLLTNALAYTDAPGKVFIRAFREKGTAVVLVEDTPPGVDRDECERLFEPLYRRESSRSRRTGGAGLGLAICRKVAEAHGGTITASASSLGGLCVRVELPLIELDHG